ncbi:Variable outer membrane protein (plasmid) [Borrelia crocidurae DOU]|uniref:Variable outer membrane protein n=1 Tax=Borrelia crocidurae DOU TaxID=1293575 RepID=W5SLY4_9SPIR|nr:Vsp/OspC family lipoprotein [Borrelia crocidurae]AHH07698.1 Variable outer membrane protein [Borrelia crocidurae DOU]
MLVMIVMGCNSGGVSGEGTGEEGKGRKGDGSVIDLKVIGEKIKSVVEFVTSVKEVHALVRSVGEFAKAIGKKVTQNTGVIAADAGGNNNGGLIAGAYSLISELNTKVEALGKKDGNSFELKTKFDDVNKKCKAFLDKVKEDSDLCKKDVTDENAQKALDINNATKDKGASELAALNTSIDGLLKSVTDMIEASIGELTVKPIVKNE